MDTWLSPSNENKMSHHWRERAWQRDVRLGVMENLGVRRPVVGSIAWLGVDVAAGQWWNKKLPRTMSLLRTAWRESNSSERKRGADIDGHCTRSREESAKLSTKWCSA